MKLSRVFVVRVHLGAVLSTLSELSAIEDGLPVASSLPAETDRCLGMRELSTLRGKRARATARLAFASFISFFLSLTPPLSLLLRSAERANVPNKYNERSRGPVRPDATVH